MQPIYPSEGKSPVPRGAPRKTLRPWRYYPLLALRTAALTAIVLACFAYAVREGAFEPAPAAVERPEPVPAPAVLETPMAVFPAAERPRSDSLAMVKTPARTAEKAPARQAAGRPRLSPEASGRWFAKVDFQRRGENQEETAEAAEAPRRNLPDGAVVIGGAELSRKIKVKGSRPVPPAAARRYSLVDKEAEGLRLERLRLAEAAEAARQRELRKRAALAALALALLAALSVAASRVISAWRSIHKPDGPHWTLK